MPRPSKKALAVVEPPNSMVASAARITAKRRDRPRGNGPQEWQLEGWHFYDTVGELGFVVQWQANAMSQVTLRLVKENADGTTSEVKDDSTNPLDQLAVEAMQALFDGDSGQAQMMAALGTHLSVPGEAYLVGLPAQDQDGELGRDQWRVVSNDEIRETSPGSGVWEMDRGDGDIERLDVNPKEDGTPPDALIIRIWRPHPRKYVEATSPVRAALPVLRQLEGLSKHTASGIDSRLAGAGILLVPTEMTFQTPVDGTPPEDAEVDAFLAALTDAMMTALVDPGSAAARVPIVVKAPGAFLESVKHITFESPLSDQAQALEERGIRRLALSLDIPPEVLLGQADSNHWSAWLISEDAIKIHVEPLAEVCTTGLTTRYLWLAMQGPAPVLDPAIKRYRLEPDTAQLRQRALQTTEAMALHERMLISDAALLRETRFDPGDAPNDVEKKRRLMELVAKGTPSSDLVAAALSYVMGQEVVPLPSAVPAEQKGNSPGEALPPGGGDAPPKEAPVPPPPAVEAPRNPPEQAAALLAASEVLVLRAVEKGWNRAGRRGRIRKPVPATQLDTCLAGAWDGAAGVDRIAGLCGVDGDALRGAVDTYARALLTTGAEHDPHQFTALLADRVLGRPLSVGA